MPSKSGYRVYVTCDIGPALKRLEEAGCQVELYDSLQAPAKEKLLQKVASGIDALISTSRDRLDEEVLRAGQGTLKIVAQFAVGYDNIDLEAAGRFQIPIANTADVLTHATAEYALFLLGSVARRLYPAEELVRSGDWKAWHAFRPFLGDEVTGKTVGVIGVGRIGKAFLCKCTGLDVNLIFHNRSPVDSEFKRKLTEMISIRKNLGLSRFGCRAREASLEEVLEMSDFLSLHLPLNSESHRLLGSRELAMMKPTAFLINTSRGKVVDEEALAKALLEGRIQGAALDVFEEEPLAMNSPLRRPELSRKVRLLPHFGSATRETRLSCDPAVGMAGRCVQAVLDVLEGNYGGDPSRMPYVVNRDAFQPGDV